MSSDKGILLFNLGGPEKLDEVEPFLYNLFSDPDIIRIRNDFFRKLLARFIATTRRRKSRGLYRQIGGGSPLRKITEAQAAALQDRLGARGLQLRVYVGMRCWKPSIDEALVNIRRDGIRRLVALPLFPQFSLTTTGSCFNHLRKLLDRDGRTSELNVSYVDAWYGEPRYIDAMVDLIREAQGRFRGGNPEKAHLLYSAHSIPARYIDEGDPYLEQTKQTVDLINSGLGGSAPWTLAFQSKVGPVKWLGPATNKVLAQLGGNGVEKVLVIPISFVSDHIETLQEIDIAYRALAEQSGIREFHRAAVPNLNPKFIDALADIAQRVLQPSSPR